MIIKTNQIKNSVSLLPKITIVECYLYANELIFRDKKLGYELRSEVDYPELIGKMSEISLAKLGRSEADIVLSDFSQYPDSYLFDAPPNEMPKTSMVFFDDLLTMANNLDLKKYGDNQHITFCNGDVFSHIGDDCNLVIKHKLTNNEAQNLSDFDNVTFAVPYFFISFLQKLSKKIDKNTVAYFTIYRDFVNVKIGEYDLTVKNCKPLNIDAFEQAYAKILANSIKINFDGNIYANFFSVMNLSKEFDYSKINNEKRFILRTNCEVEEIDLYGWYEEVEINSTHKDELVETHRAKFNSQWVDLIVEKLTALNMAFVLYFPKNHYNQSKKGYEESARMPMVINVDNGAYEYIIAPKAW